MSMIKTRRDYARSNMPAFRKWCADRNKKPTLNNDKNLMAFYSSHNQSKAAKAYVYKPQATMPRPVYQEPPLVLIGATKPTTVHTRQHGTDSLNTYAVSETQERLTVSEKVSAGILTIVD